MLSTNTLTQLDQCTDILKKCGLNLTWRDRMNSGRESSYDLIIHAEPKISMLENGVISRANKDEFAIAVNAIHYLLNKIEDTSYKESEPRDVISDLRKFKYAGEDVQITITAPRIITAQTDDIFELIMGPYFTANCTANQGENDERSVAPDAQ